MAYRRITVDNYAAALAEAEAAVQPAKEKLDRLKDALEKRVAPRSDFETDPAAAFRRRTPRQARQADARLSREAEAWKELEAAEQEYELCRSRAERMRSSLPVPYTEEELRAASHVRTVDGWYQLLKVNRVTVAVQAEFPWPYPIRRELVLEVRSAAREPEVDASLPDASTGDEVEDVRNAVEAFHAASEGEGDYTDAEHDAAVALARAAESLVDSVEPGGPAGEVSDVQ